MTLTFEEEVNKSKSFIIVEAEEGEIKLEYNQWIPILHIKRLEKFNRDTFRWGVYQTERICEFLHTVGYRTVYVAVASDEPKINKVARRLGFSFVKESDGMNVYERGLD